MFLNSEDKFADEQELARFLLGESYFLDDPDIIQHTQSIIRYCRNNKNQRTKLDVFMEQYGLSNSEGIALMCLAESLMRIPDNQTRDTLINEKLTSAKWSEHLGKAESFLVNSVTRGLTFSKEFLRASNHASNNWLIAMGEKIGKSSIREAVHVAMQVLSKEFVCAESIKELKDSKWLKAHSCSFDMLGEAARNEEQSIKYFESYLESIQLISEINLDASLSNGISIKLSALYSKYDTLHGKNVKKVLLPRLKDLVVEAATENMDIKLKIFSQLDEVCGENVILASNTSSISITKIASVTNRPDKVIGMHFMNPVPVMKLVEIIRGYATSDDVTDQIMQLSRDLKKSPVEVNDYPGFVANRILMPMINEAVYTLYEGVAGVEEIFSRFNILSRFFSIVFIPRCKESAEISINETS